MKHEPLCCPNCFKTPIVAHTILATGIPGDCEECGSRQVPLVHASRLARFFEPLLKHYQFIGQPESIAVESCPSEHQLASVLEADGLSPFGPNLSVESRTAILASFLLNYNEPRLRLACAEGAWSSVYEPKYAPNSSPWERLRNEIRFKHRFSINLTASAMPNILELLRAAAPDYVEDLPPSTDLFRARLHDDSNSNRVFTAAELAAPPPENASSSRASPAGIPILYSADSRDTAIAEVRPYLGGIVCVGQMNRRRSLRIFDFSRPPAQQVLDPVGDAVDIQIPGRSLIVYLDREFAEPVAPHQPDRDYAPTQFIAEFIASLDFDGIKYKSAMYDGGYNYAIFDPAEIEPVYLETVKISRLVMRSEPFDPKDPYGTFAAFEALDENDADEEDDEPGG
jgi:RES domain-containing protein